VRMAAPSPCTCWWEEASVEQASTIGLDIAKRVFQAHGADASGRVAFRKRLTRVKLLEFFAAQPSCTVAMEACAGAHHWAEAARFRPRSGWKTAGGAQDRRVGPHRAPDPASLRQAVCEAAEERHGGRRGDLRGGAAADHAFRAGEGRGAAGERRRVPGPCPAGAATHPVPQRPARAPVRVRLRRSPGDHARRCIDRPCRGPRHRAARARGWSRRC
jgi:hypothetical protein